MLSCNQQGIHNLPSYLNSHSFKSRLIPSFLALSVITALYSPLQAAWVYNKPSNTTQNGENITASDTGTVSNKNWIFFTNTSGNTGSLTISGSLTASGTGTGGGVNVSNGRTVGTITIGSGGALSTQHHGINIMQNAHAAKIDVQGSLSVQGNNGHGINIHNNANVSEISINGNLSASGSNGQGININN
ncbi:hypothetical protein CVU5213_08710, partial [Campylobacter vulpis]